MSLIACTDQCVYQQNGYCSLIRAGSRGEPSHQSPCVNFVPKRAHRSQCGVERLPDVGNANEL